MFWLNLLVFILAAAGHAELQVTLLNRLHARTWPEKTLERLRRVHDLLLVLVPVLLVVFAGLTGPRLLLGGTWAETGWGWRAVFALCGLGFIGLVVSAVRWQLQRPAGCCQATRCRTVDIAQRLGRAPVGEGPYRRLVGWPGNQVFRVEFSEKEFTAPRLPDAISELRILHLSDFHFVGTVDRSFFREVCRLAAETRPDLIAFTGDLFDDLRYLDWLPKTLGTLDAPLGRYFILGNHDERLGPESVRKAMRELGWCDLAGRAVTIEAGENTENDSEGGATRLLLAGTERPWMGHDPPTETDQPADFKILLSHTPDRFNWARQAGFDLMLSGHNHGGQVVLPIVGPVYSPSRHGVRYAAGSWWQPPTLLHVSRGLSGKHPLRLNCPPEVATLILTPPGTATQSVRVREQVGQCL